MKKLVLLFTIVCTGQLYGMEPEKHQTVKFGEEWATLPDDIKSLILVALMQSGNDLDSAIKSIVKASAINVALNKMINYNDLQGFTKIAHMLANKFGISTFSIAKEFSTQTSKEYVRLLEQAHYYMGEPIGDHVTDEIDELIKEGLDVNAIYSDGKSLLQKAILTDRGLELVNLLLNSGANPHYKDNEGCAALDHAEKQSSKVGKTALDRLMISIQQPILEKIISLLE